MSEFKEIKTQEEFESILKERLERSKASVRKEFEGYISPTELATLKTEHQKQIDALNSSIKEKETQYASFDSQIKERDAKIAQYETDSVKTRVAIEMGIPLDLASRLQGATEDEIKADAQKLASFSTKKYAAPLANPEPVLTEQQSKERELDAEYRKMLNGLKNN